MSYKADPESQYVSTEYELDLSEDDVRIFGQQYQKGPVFFKGKWISNIKDVEIRETERDSKSYYPKLDSSTIFFGDRIKTGVVTRKFLFGESREIAVEEKLKPSRPSKNFFIVHGRDDKPKLELARMLEKLGFNAIILSEQPDKGRTIIEKLEQESIDVGYVFVILTPEDVITDLPFPPPPPPFPPFEFRYRARQNVILELGYFVGKIGRDRVCCLYRGDVELPSDIHGVLFKKFNKSIEECYKGILEELNAAGYEIKI